LLAVEAYFEAQLADPDQQIQSMTDSQRKGGDWRRLKWLVAGGV